MVASGGIADPRVQGPWEELARAGEAAATRVVDSCSVLPRRTPIMDITILAAWGEFLGGIAVVVSLLYLRSRSGRTHGSCGRRRAPHPVPLQTTTSL